MIKKYTLYVMVIVVAVTLIGVGGYFIINSKSFTVIPVTDQVEINQPELILYSNTDYGFDFSLPSSWKGYSIVVDKWVGQMLDTKGRVESIKQIEGVKILIRHPLWTKEIVRQDIPIMIFTLNQWNLIQQEELSVGAAPIGPSELGRNKNYVFALPARYNYAFPVGFEEVQKIIDSKSLRAF